jgi:hypothetical protein
MISGSSKKEGGVMQLYPTDLRQRSLKHTREKDNPSTPSTNVAGKTGYPLVED